MLRAKEAEHKKNKDLLFVCVYITGFSSVELLHEIPFSGTHTENSVAGTNAGVTNNSNDDSIPFLCPRASVLCIMSP